MPATMATGSPTRSVPLVSGAEYSSVFDRGSVAKFDTTIFRRGVESRPFALESWVLPIPKTRGFEAQSYRENLATAGTISTNVGATLTPNVTWGDFGVWNQVSATVASRGVRMSVPLSLLKNNTYYTVAVTLGNNGTTPVTTILDWCDSAPPTIVTLAAGAGEVVTFSAVREVYDSAYRFLDIAVRDAGTSVLFKNIVIIEGRNVDATYFDGGMPGCEWAGAAGSSVSRTRKEVAAKNLVLRPIMSGPGSIQSGWVGTTYASSNTTINAVSCYSGGVAASPGKTATGIWSVTNPTDAPITTDFLLRAAGGPTFIYAGGHPGLPTTETIAPGQTKVIRAKVTIRPKESGFRLHIDGGVGLILNRALATDDDYDGPIFTGSDDGAVWNGTTNQSVSHMLPSEGPQAVLSHSNEYDGITISGSTVRFGTTYLSTGSAICEYDMGERKLAHVVGVHNADANELWVNGEQVATVAITDEQKADMYAASTSELYCGHTTASQAIAMNAAAIYGTLSGDDIRRNYLAGIEFIGQRAVASQFGGISLDLSSENGSVFINETWTTKSQFELGFKNNVELGEQRIEPSFENGVSIPGSWTVSIPLDAQQDPTIYGVVVSWSGYGVSVESSLDGITWSTVSRGVPVASVPAGFNPAGKDLQVRVNFAGGKALDPAYLESLTITGYRNSKVMNLTAREVTTTYPAVVRGDFETNLYRDDNGVSMNGGALVIGGDTTPEPVPLRTLEMWIKPLSLPLSIPVPGATRYRNGVPDTVLPVGQWSLVHFVASSDVIAGAITVSGDAIVGQATLYPTALTAEQVNFIWKSYTGRTATRLADNNTIVVQEPTAPTRIYAYDWAINSAG